MYGSSDAGQHGDNPAFHLNQTARLISRHFDQRLDPLGLNVANLAVLGALNDAARLSQKELAEIGRIGQSAMAQMLERMVKEGILVRTPDVTDRRKVMFALSASGRELIPKVKLHLEVGNAQIFSALATGELDTLLAILKTLSTRLTQLEFSRE